MDDESLLIILVVIAAILYVLRRAAFFHKKYSNSSELEDPRQRGNGEECHGYMPETVSSWDANAEVIWSAGRAIDVEFRYRDRNGFVSDRRIQLERIIKKHAKYLQGYCYLRREKRTFRLSKIQGDIIFGEKVLRKEELMDYLLGGGEQRRARRGEYAIYDTKSKRSEFIRRSNGKVDWRAEGILSLSGYHVGKTKGVKESERRAILNSLLLEDDLSDVDDADYVAEWGRPRSLKRYKKIVDSIKTFHANARGRMRGGKVDLSDAITDWGSDLSYLKKSQRNADK